MKPTKPMAVTSVKLLLEALTCEVDGLSAPLKALTRAPGVFGRRWLIDGPRKVLISPSGATGGMPFMGSVWICDPALEFSVDGDPLWAFDHMLNGRAVAGDLRQKALIIERALVEAFGRDCIRAYRAVVLLAGMHSIPVPALSPALGARQGVPEAAK